ncbi:hypothetical protein DL98DRAFT_515726 [Cadophora sp. DSE1049]|nr:hypothetical protein DL98DRAFT_515726 [Cadophora sp. DSE1049]
MVTLRRVPAVLFLLAISEAIYTSVDVIIARNPKPGLSTDVGFVDDRSHDSSPVASPTKLSKSVVLVLIHIWVDLPRFGSVL